MRFDFDSRKSKRLRRNRGIGFEEAQEIFSHPHYVDLRSDQPEQYITIGWVGNHRLYSLVFEMREDRDGEYCHLVTLWKSTSEEENLYAENK